MANNGQINPSSVSLTDFFQAYRNGVSFLVRGVDIKNNIAVGGSGFSTLSEVSHVTFVNEDNFALVTVSSALITVANIKSVTFIPIETTETSLDDFTLNGVTLNIENIVDNTSFVFRATAVNGATGTYTFKYIITYS